jgi:phosphoribosyl 1,2-cyclic phosphodiesterase
MIPPSDFLVRFWGARGSIPCSGADSDRYGGDTACVEVRCGDRLLIFDAGSGLRCLGRLLAESACISGDIFLTHTHLDHIIGFPFFRPAYYRDNAFRVWAGHLLPTDDVKSVICRPHAGTVFPRSGREDAGGCQLSQLPRGRRPGTSARDPHTHSTSKPSQPRDGLPHRFCRKISLLRHRHRAPQRRDETILDLIDGADIVIYDAQYSDEEYPSFRGFGHSTWEEGVRLVEAAGAGILVAFHHDPDHDDVFLERVEKALAEARPGSMVARTGLVLHP